MSSSSPPAQAPQQSLPALLGRLWRHLSPRRQSQLGMLLLLMLASAFVETVSLGLVLPFLGVLTAPEQVLGNHPALAGLVSGWGIATAADLLLPLTLAFAAMALAAGAFRMLLLWTTTRLANAIGADLSIDVYRRTLYQPYRVHIARNSSEVITGLVAKVNGAAAVLQSVLTFISSLVLLVAIMAALLAIDPMVASAAAVGFGASYVLITWMFRRRLQRNAERIARESTQIVKALFEGLGAIRDVLLDGTQAFYCDVYRRADQPARVAQASNAFIAGSPRFVMEALGMILIAALAYGLTSKAGGVGSALPVLGALALGAQRLLPVLQQGYASWATIASSRASLADALELLDQPLPEDSLRPPPPPLPFADVIRFENVRFRFTLNGPWVLDDVNFAIARGTRVGFVGTTGSGKSTLLALLMGLTEPGSGAVLVDGVPINGQSRRAWQRNIAHVPQSIYLADISLAENIAFGVPRESIDMERVRVAARQAQIADFIESGPNGYEAQVGERGIRLSGGQRQRIGIARALYKRASVIVFDEATSALDNATERELMRSIDRISGGLTIITVAHRLSTIKNCDVIFELERGRLVAQGTYEELLGSSASFRHMAEKAVSEELSSADGAATSQSQARPSA
jgi:ATP-binding cassette subfamily B protein